MERVTMKEKKAVTKVLADRYRKSTKKGKGMILNEFVQITGHTRNYASWLLRVFGTEKYVWINGERARIIVGYTKKRKQTKRPRIYDDEVKKAVRKIWYMFDCICGKRLVTVLRTMVPILEKFGEIHLTPVTRDKITHISAATIDRLLQAEKKKFRIKGRSHTKPSSMLKSKIPIRTFGDWDEKTPGFVEIDLVGHDGGNTRGEFCFTLDVTDVSTGWSEPIGIRNKAQKWTFEALQEVKTHRLPFPLLGIDSDNGSEFINDQLYRYCGNNNIVFTRSRANRKNDNCFVEEKNNSIVRRNVGYQRYDTEEELAVLNEIYSILRLLVNFFYPSMKLVEKIREGSKVKKKYDRATTPYQRLLDANTLDEITRKKLALQFNSLNPVELQRSMNKLKQHLFSMARYELVENVQ